ncbi:MAG: hypothetical protein KF696_06465 [Planctomycetes bacterium]|nr:hypothetical protein [Planctomycetota bacterium]MCW8136524.1 hypothetical protein [Planctomycetota bacterium]
MAVYIECLCGKRFQVDPAQVSQFECEGCGRSLTVPKPELAATLEKLRERMKQGEPGMREAMAAAAKIREFHAVPLLKEGAQSGVREAVNTALVALCDLPGPGQEVITEWIGNGMLSVTRLVAALRESKYDKGADFVCTLVAADKLRESHVAEVAPYLGESGTQRALETLKDLRRKYPNLGGILDSALAKLRHLDEGAGTIPDEAKVIPGRQSQREPAARKGCLALLLAIVGVLGTLAALLWQ